jgi:hypothetical protein
MKKLSFQECRNLAKKNQVVVPADYALWKKVKGICESDNKTLLISVYNNLGGNWQILESSTKVRSRVKSGEVDEAIDLGPLTGSKNASRSKHWLKRLKEFDPMTYERFLNWD